jgi:hypothetical protein
MAIISFKEIHHGRDGGIELKRDGGQLTRYSRVFRVKTDYSGDEATVILAHASSPRIGSPYPWDATAYCQRVIPRNESFSKRVWLVTAAYSNEREITADPLSEPAVIEWSSEQFQKIAVLDKNDEAIVNSAGDEWDPPAEMDDSRWTATIRKNVAAVPSWLFAYQDRINAAGFTLDGLAIPAEVAKMQAIRIGGQQERNGTDYRVLQITMHFRTRVTTGTLDISGWTLRIMDAGFRQKVEVGTTGTYEMQNIKNDGDGQKITAPVALDGSGLVLSDPTATTIVFLPFEVYDTADFSALPLT